MPPSLEELNSISGNHLVERCPLTSMCLPGIKEIVKTRIRAAAGSGVAHYLHTRTALGSQSTTGAALWRQRQTDSQEPGWLD